MTSKSTLTACFICAVLVFTPVFSSAQSEGQESKSLADLAREQRLKKDKDEKQPAKVYTNEDMPTHPPDAPSTASAAKTSAGGTEKANGDADSDSNASASVPHDEKYFRSKMDELRANLESDKKGLASLQDEMDKHMKDVSTGRGPTSSMLFHENPHWTTDPVGSWYFWNSEDKRLRSSIDSQKEKIASDEKSIADFVDQCRREDCKPGWIQ